MAKSKALNLKEGARRRRGPFPSSSEGGIRLTHGVDGAWRTTLHLEPGEYQVRLRVNGEWRDVPDVEERVPNPYGSENAVLKVH